MLRVEGLTTGAGGPALTFDVPNGRCTGLLGNDLTALRHIAECACGMRLPVAGRVMIGDHGDLDIQREHDRARRQIAVSLARTPHRLTSIGEHLDAIAGTRPARVAAAAGIARLGLDPKMRSTTPGARAAAALAAALLPDAPIVVLHDPFRDLAADVRAKAIDWIRSLSDSGTSVLITGAEERDVRAVSHSVVEIGSGR